MGDDRIGQLGSLKIRLADWLPADQRYQRRYIPVDFESEVASGEQGLAPVPRFRPFSMRAWRGGEGITWWEREVNKYRESTNVRPVSILDGLELGAHQDVTDRAGSTFDDGQRFGYGLGDMWTIVDNTMYPWDRSVPDWDTGTATGAGGNDATSITDGSDATNMFVGLANGVIRKVADGGSSSQLVAGGTFTFAPVLRSYLGVLYALDGDDLYTIHQTTGARTQVGDIPGGSSSDYLNSTPWSYGRMTLSDKGPVWMQRLNNGQGVLWEYNHHSEDQHRIGKLPVDFAFPYSTFFSKGFVFVGFRYASEHGEAGDAYIWFKRGAQDGILGPVRAPSGSTASKPVLIAGFIGDDLIFYFDGAVWAYNVSDGGLFQVAEQTTTGTPQDAITFGKEVFIAPVTSGGNSSAVERFDTQAYTTETATIDLGKHDWDYPGLQKVLLDVTIITDPLPANTSVRPAVAVDGGSFTNIGSASGTAGKSKHTFTVSTSGGTVAGNEFELRLILSTAVIGSTPTVREVSARAKASAHLVEIVLGVDCGELGDQTSFELIDGLNLLAAPATPSLVSLKDPWQNRDRDTPDTFDVTVQQVVTPKVEDGEDDEERSAVVVLQRADLV